MIASKRIERAAKTLTVLLAMGLVTAACGPAAVNPEATTQPVDQAEVPSDSTETTEEREPEAKPFEFEVDPGQEDSSGGLAIEPGSAESDGEGLPVGFTEDGHPYRGDPNAPVVIQEYSDYQCPFCSRFFSQTLPALMEKQIAEREAVLIYYDFPLESIHPQASAAANAARCAGEQGAASYWAMHDALFADIARWSNDNANETFSEMAKAIDLIR